MHSSIRRLIGQWKLLYRLKDRWCVSQCTIRDQGCLKRSNRLSGSVFTRWNGLQCRMALVVAWDLDYISARPLLSYIMGKWVCRALLVKDRPSGLRCRWREIKPHCQGTRKECPGSVYFSKVLLL